MSDMPDMPVDLYAFWSYDQFPYFLSSKVTKFKTDNPAAVETVSYGKGQYFRYFHLESGESGKHLHELGEKLSSTYKLFMKSMSDELHDFAFAKFQSTQLPEIEKLKPNPTSSRTNNLIRAAFIELYNHGTD